MYCEQKAQFKYGDLHKLKIKLWRKHSKFIRDEEEHYIMKNASLQN